MLPLGGAALISTLHTHIFTGITILPINRQKRGEPHRKMTVGPRNIELYKIIHVIQGTSVCCHQIQSENYQY